MQLANQLDEFERSLNILANQATHLQNFIRGSCRQVECSNRRVIISLMMQRGRVRHVTSSCRDINQPWTEARHRVVFTPPSEYLEEPTNTKNSGNRPGGIYSTIILKATFVKI